MDTYQQAIFEMLKAANPAHALSRQYYGSLPPSCFDRSASAKKAAAEASLKRKRKRL